MQIIYTCPKCGHDLQHIAIYTDPPINQSECPNCGWRYEQRQDIIRVPYPYPAFKDNSIPLACQKCSNHPLNGGSGICHCTLGTTPVIC